MVSLSYPIDRLDGHCSVLQYCSIISFFYWKKLGIRPLIYPKTSLRFWSFLQGRAGYHPLPTVQCGAGRLSLVACSYQINGFNDTKFSFETSTKLMHQHQHHTIYSYRSSLTIPAPSINNQHQQLEQMIPAPSMEMRSFFLGASRSSSYSPPSPW